MLRYDRQTKPGLVVLYDNRPGNGAGLFLQPWSPHGAPYPMIHVTYAPMFQAAPNRQPVFLVSQTRMRLENSCK